MKKRFLAMFAVVTFFILSAVPASAVVNDTIKVGLRYGSSAMTSANLENDVGEGYEFGYFDSDRNFVSLEWTDETTITMSPSGHGTIQVTVTGQMRSCMSLMEIRWAFCHRGEALPPGSGLQVSWRI